MQVEIEVVNQSSVPASYDCSLQVFSMIHQTLHLRDYNLAITIIFFEDIKINTGHLRFKMLN